MRNSEISQANSNNPNYVILNGVKSIYSHAISQKATMKKNAILKDDE
jgi:hypothetical protein